MNILENGKYDIPLGKVAMVITVLEMTEKPDLKETPAPQGWTARRVQEPDAIWYRDLMRRVGGDWLWYSRLRLPIHDLNDILRDPDVHIWTISNGAEDAGLMELKFGQQGACELAFFGLASTLIGKGAGRYLMNCAINEAWARPITRFHLQTCTLDSPQALGFYRRSGFMPVSQKIEIADDPRLDGTLTEQHALQVPIFAP